MGLRTMFRHIRIHQTLLTREFLERRKQTFLFKVMVSCILLVSEFHLRVLRPDPSMPYLVETRTNNTRMPQKRDNPLF